MRDESGDADARASDAAEMNDDDDDVSRATRAGDASTTTATTTAPPAPIDASDSVLTPTKTPRDVANADATRALPTKGSGKGVGVAFFDLDHTIIDANSSWLWVKSEINAGRVGFSLITQAMYWFGRYALGYGDGAETAGKEAAALYKGEREEAFRGRIEDFFRMELQHRVRPGFKRTLAAHIENEDRCVMCTSTWQHPAAIGAEIYGLETGEENIVCSVMGVDENGVMDGNINVVAYGDGKYDTTKAWCEKHGVDMKDCYFYTDSMTDVKLLEHVGYPVCVNPDPRLKAHALKRGWPIYDWGVSPPLFTKPRYSYACLRSP
jgi:HAD superfamily hydrolase (TIGR01490 family)